MLLSTTSFFFSFLVCLISFLFCLIVLVLSYCFQADGDIFPHIRHYHLVVIIIQTTSVPYLTADDDDEVNDRSARSSFFTQYAHGPISK